MRLEPIQKLRLYLGINDKDELLSLLLDNSKELLLDYLGRDELPVRLEGVQVQLAVIAYNRMGAEGSVSFKEGNYSQNCIDGLPKEHRERLRYYKRKVGVMRDSVDDNESVGI